MDDLTLPKNKLTEFINKIKSDYTVFAPVKIDSLVYFKKIDKFSDITLDFYNSKVPPKSIMFKQTETMFKFKHGLKAEIQPLDEKNKKTVIFGIRPCDAKSISILDNVFEDDFIDPYYVDKRKNTVFVGLSCNQPAINCFCTSMDGGPYDSKHLDVLFSDIGDRFYVEIQNNKGRNLINSVKGLFKKASNEDKKKRQQLEKKSNDKISRNMKTTGITEKLDKIFDDDFWKNISLRCLSCGICTYECPTCHCFDIHDETTLSDGARIRVWDTCMNPEYTVHASGHNPRPTRMNRTRNRVYHKFNYFPKNYNVIACVGCGRCINDCPVNIDIIEIIDKAGEVKL